MCSGGKRSQRVSLSAARRFTGNRRTFHNWVIMAALCGSKGLEIPKQRPRPLNHRRPIRSPIHRCQLIFRNLIRRRSSLIHSSGLRSGDHGTRSGSFGHRFLPK